MGKEWKPATSKRQYKILRDKYGSSRQIGKALNVSHSKVLDDLRRLGILDNGPKPKRVKKPNTMELNDKLDDLIRILRASRMNIPQIASTLNVDVDIVPFLLQFAYDKGFYLRADKIGKEKFYYVPKAMSLEVRHIFRDYLKDTGTLKFGVVSDTHLASKYECLEELHSFYDICVKEKIKRVYHAGDILEGRKVYRGQENEVKFWSLDDQVDHLIANYPQRKGIATHFISGGHDETVLKWESIDMGRRIVDAGLSAGRKDLLYLGQSHATIEIMPGIYLEIIHPGGGTAYAVSYNMQKYIESMTGGTKPNILLRGHGHKSLQMPRRGVQGFEAGCFQKQTPFMRSRGLIAEVGGWIIEIQAISGSIRSIKGRWIPYY